MAAGRDILDTPEAGPAAIRGSAIRGVGYVLGMLLSVLSVSLLIRHLGVIDFGRYVTVVSLVTIVQGLSDAGLSSVGVREFAIRASGDRAQLVRNLNGLRLLLSTVGILAAALFALAAGYTDEQVAGTLLAGVGLVLATAQGTLTIPLHAELRLGLVTAIELLRQVLTVAVIAALVMSGASLLAFLSVPIPVGALVLGLTIAALRHTVPVLPAFDRAEWLALARAVLPFAAAVALGAIYLRVTVILMSVLASEVEIGYYAASYRVIEVLIGIPALVVGAALPILSRAARDDRDRLSYVLQRLSQATLLAGGLLSLTLVAGAEFALDVLAGDEGRPAVGVLQIQAAAVVVNFILSSWQYGLLALHRHTELLVNAVFGLVVSVGLCFLLIPPLGAEGAAMAFVAGESAFAVVAYLQLRRAHPDFRLEPAVPARVAVAAAVAALVALVPPDMPSLVRAVLAAGIYTAGVLWLRAVPSELVDAFRRPAAR